MSVPTLTTTVLECTRSDTAMWDVVVTDYAGAAANITGATSYFTIRKTSAANQTADSDAILQVSSSSGITYTAPATGRMRITLTAAQTRLLSVRSYLWDLQIKSTNTFTAAKGVLLVTNEQTRTT